MGNSRKDFPTNRGGRLELSGNIPEVLCWLRPLVNLLAGLAVHTGNHGGFLPLEPFKGYLLPPYKPISALPHFFLPMSL